MKTVKAKFLKPTIGIGYGYFAGDVVDLSTNLFDELKELGYIEEYKPEPVDIVSDFPDDLPAKEKLSEAGILLISDLKKIDDFTEIEGIGKKLNEEIKGYLAEQGL